MDAEGFVRCGVFLKCVVLGEDFAELEIKSGDALFDGFGLVA